MGLDKLLTNVVWYNVILYVTCVSFIYSIELIAAGSDGLSKCMCFLFAPWTAPRNLRNTMQTEGLPFHTPSVLLPE